MSFLNESTLETVCKERGTFHNEKAAFHGFVPVKVDKEVAQLEFVIKEKVLMSDRLNRKNRLKDNPLIQITRKEFDSVT